MLIRLRDDDPRPIYGQIVSEIKEQIRVGTLAAGDELPSVRELADTLGINLHTVHKAYQILREQGVIHLRLGRRARVAPRRDRPLHPKAVQAQLRERLRELATDAYHLGFSREALRRLMDESLEA